MVEVDLSGLTDKEREYLEIIYYLDARGEPVIAARIADWLKVTPPTVSNMVGRLLQKALVSREADGTLALTAAGQPLAEAVVRRHRLLECFLVDVMGMPWHSIHEEAVHLETSMSPLMAEKIELLVGRSETCPHGNPVPGNRQSYPGSVRLADVAAGESFRLLRIVEEAEEDLELMRFMQTSGFIPGVAVLIRETSPRFGMVLGLKGQSVALSTEVTGVLWGERVTSIPAGDVNP